MFELVPPIQSPCTNVCRMDSRTGWCLGCGRTLGEIARWGTTDETDRSAIMAELPSRMAALGN